MPTGGWGETPTVFVEDGVVGDLWEVTSNLFQARFAQLIEQIDLANRTEDSVERFTFVVGSTEGDEIQLPVHDVPKTLFLMNENGVGYSMRQITAVGKGEIHISKIPLTHGRLGDWNVNFGYGEGKVAGRDALLVVSEQDEGPGMLTMRIRPIGEDDSEVTPAASQRDI